MPSPAPARRLPLRRRDLLIGGLAGLAVAASGAEAARSLWDAAVDVHPLPDHPATGPVHMQIVAHPDDCLYFINPRVGRAMSAGAGICTVVLTAGEADGRNARDPAAAPDWASYAAARNTGLRRAYAYLATGDAESPWERYCSRLETGQSVEVGVLAARPEIHVVFCSLWTNLGRLTGQYTRLLSLWEGRLDASAVLQPAGSPLTGGGTVDRATVAASLLELLDHYRPAAVNTLDPDPDRVVGPRLGAEQRGYSDHIDHTAAALFAWEAVRDWGRAPVIESWRGYYNRRWPGNLGAADRDLKGRALNVYSWADGADCDAPVGCGDRVVLGPGVGDAYGAATHPRYGTAVAAARSGGRTVPVTVRGMRLHARTERAWTDLGGPDLLPALATAGSRVFALAPEHTPDPDAHVRDLHCLDLSTGEWEHLGNPGGEGEAARNIGVPTAVAGGTTVLVAVRSPTRGLAVRTRSDDGWSEWTQLGGRMVDAAPSAWARPDGGLGLVAATPAGLAEWRWHGDRWTTRDLRLPHVGGAGGYVPASAVSAAALPDGRTVFASRGAGSADVVVHLGSDARWTAAVLPLEGGIYPPTIATGPDNAVAVAADNHLGTAAVALFRADDLERPGPDRPQIHWSHGDVVLTRRPALAFDSEGGLALWTVGLDGEPYAAASAPGEAPPAAWAPALGNGD